VKQAKHALILLQAALFSTDFRAKSNTTPPGYCGKTQPKNALVIQLERRYNYMLFRK
jgi:hypothetical protein